MIGSRIFLVAAGNNCLYSLLMADSITSMKEHLKFLADIYRQNTTERGFKYSSPEDVVVQLGRAFRSKAPASEVVAMPKGQCFNNAFDLWMNSEGLYYCEGFGLAAGFHPCLHAWLCTEDGVIIDPTWAEDDHTVDHYLGCVFDHDWFSNHVNKTGYAGVFNDGRTGMFDLDILRGEFELTDPGFRSFLSA